MGSNSSETLGPRHSKAHTEGWAYNRVSTVKQISYRMNLRSRWNTFDICSTCMVKMLPQLEANINGRPTNIPKTILEPGPQFTKTEFKWGDKVPFTLNYKPTPGGLEFK